MVSDTEFGCDVLNTKAANNLLAKSTGLQNG